jgi:tRNA threonylcarbamoyladenosine biosynthesis protein TsaB
VILGLDTASAMSSVALVDAGVLVASEQVEGARQHVEVLAPMLARVLAGIEPDSITAVACDVGPGPYSGLRVAVASAIACGLAWGVPVYGVCSLDVIAAATLADGSSSLRSGRESGAETRADLKTDGGFGVALDARRKEVYWAWYSATGERVAGPRVGRRDDLPDAFAEGPWIDMRLPHAEWVARSVEWLLLDGTAVSIDDVPLTAHGDDGSPPADALVGRVLLPPRPLYLRRPDVTVSPANAGVQA